MKRDEVIADAIRLTNGMIDEIDRLQRAVDVLQEDNERLRQALGAKIGEDADLDPHRKAVLATTGLATCSGVCSMTDFTLALASRLCSASQTLTLAAERRGENEFAQRLRECVIELEAMIARRTRCRCGQACKMCGECANCCECRLE